MLGQAEDSEKQVIQSNKVCSCAELKIPCNDVVLCLPCDGLQLFAKPPASASVSRAWLQLAPLSAEQHHLVTRLRPEGVERNCEIHTQQIKDY